MRRRDFAKMLAAAPVALVAAPSKAAVEPVKVANPVQVTADDMIPFKPSPPLSLPVKAVAAPAEPEDAILIPEVDSEMTRMIIDMVRQHAVDNGVNIQSFERQTRDFQAYSATVPITAVYSDGIMVDGKSLGFRRDTISVKLLPLRRCYDSFVMETNPLLYADKLEPATRINVIKTLAGHMRGSIMQTSIALCVWVEGLPGLAALFTHYGPVLGGWKIFLDPVTRDQAVARSSLYKIIDCLPKTAPVDASSFNPWIIPPVGGTFTIPPVGGTFTMAFNPADPAFRHGQPYGRINPLYRNM